MNVFMTYLCKCYHVFCLLQQIEMTFDLATQNPRVYHLSISKIRLWCLRYTRLTGGPEFCSSRVESVDQIVKAKTTICLTAGAQSSSLKLDVTKETTQTLTCLFVWSDGELE